MQQMAYQQKRWWQKGHGGNRDCSKGPAVNLCRFAQLLHDLAICVKHRTCSWLLFF